MKNKFVLITSFFQLVCLGTIFSQKSNDAQFWENIYIENDLTQRWAIHINQEGRITNNFSTPNYIYLDLGLTYKINKHIHCSVAYVPIAKKLETGFVSLRHQLYIDAVVRYKFGNFIVYDRQMLQNQYNDILHSSDWNIPDYYLRNKVTVKYKTDNRFIPYAAEEVYFEWNNHIANSNHIDRMRFFAGCFYKIDNINELEAYYLVEPHFHTSDPPYTNWIIGLGFSHVFF
jgi:hypothetical protein